MLASYIYSSLYLAGLSLSYMRVSLLITSLTALRAARYRSFDVGVGLVWALNVILTQGGLDLSDKLRHFVAEHLVVSQVGESIQ